MNYKRNHKQVIVEHYFWASFLREQLSKMTKAEVIEQRMSEYEKLLNRAIDEAEDFKESWYYCTELFNRKKGEEIFKTK